MAAKQEFSEWLQTAVLDYLDPRSEDWLLCFSPLVPIGIIATYLLLVLKLGPDFMAKREPFRIQPIIIAYNAVQVAACFWISSSGVYEWRTQNYSFLCQPVDRAVNAATTTAANLVYAYYILKISDLLDTVFFVLRKKSSHVSFLHVYHHAVMIMAGYVGCRYSLNGHFAMIGILNSFVHVAMYSYYLYTALFPKKKVPLSVKKCLTILQLVQFCLLTIHTALPLFQPSCRVQKLACFVLFAQFGFMMMMFLDFYQKAYLEPRKKSA